MDHDARHRYDDGWENAVAYVLDQHPSTALYESHLMGCPVCQEFVDLARVFVLREASVSQPSLLALYVLAVLWNEEQTRGVPRERMAWISA